MSSLKQNGKLKIKNIPKIIAILIKLKGTKRSEASVGINEPQV